MIHVWGDRDLDAIHASEANARWRSNGQANRSAGWRIKGLRDASLPGPLRQVINVTGNPPNYDIFFSMIVFSRDAPERLNFRSWRAWHVQLRIRLVRSKKRDFFVSNCSPPDIERLWYLGQMMNGKKRSD